MDAKISPCGLYRYTLSRGWAEGKTIAFIGVNPSTADAATDDATVRRWRGFAQRWGYAGFTVVNLFAFRSTDVAVLAKVVDPVGPGNDQFIQSVLGEVDLVVPCWGSRTKLPRGLHFRIDVVRKMLRGARAPVEVFGLTASGDPCHPLMLSYDLERAAWTP